MFDDAFPIFSGRTVTDYEEAAALADPGCFYLWLSAHGQFEECLVWTALKGTVTYSDSVVVSACGRPYSDAEDRAEELLEGALACLKEA